MMHVQGPINREIFRFQLRTIRHIIGWWWRKVQSIVKWIFLGFSYLKMGITGWWCMCKVQYVRKISVCYLCLQLCTAFVMKQVYNYKHLPHNLLQFTTQPSSIYHTTLFNLPHNPLQFTTQPSSIYHTTLFNFVYNYKHLILMKLIFWCAKQVKQHSKQRSLRSKITRGTISLHLVAA